MTRFIRDDFAGPGGWSEGLKALGLSDVVEIGVEFDLAAVLTARAAGHKRWHADVTSDAVRDYRWPTLWGYIASPPCQTFSAAGKGEGRKHLVSLAAALTLVSKGATPAEAIWAVHNEALDERSVLVLEPMLVIRDHRPTWIAFEQVPQVLPIWEAYAELLAKWGYHVATGLVHAEQHGVPQTRKRAVLVAHAERPVSLPKATHSRYYSHDKAKLDPGVPSWISMAQALGRGLASRPAPTIMAGGTATGGAEPIAHWDRYVDGPDWVPAAANEGTTEADMAWVHERPSPTIVASFAADVVARPAYRKPGDGPRQKAKGSVRVTVQEAAVLQSFRPDYPWQGTSTKQYEQVGNAIPPLLASAILAGLTA